MSFDDLISDMDATLMETLKDGCVDYLASDDETIATGLEAIVDQGVMRIDEASGATDRVVTICVIKSQLTRFDRKGAFRSNAGEPIRALSDKSWHIDGIESDDGDMITFYVVP